MADMEKKEKYTIKKRDIVLALVLLTMGAAGVLIVKYGFGQGNTAYIYIDDKLAQTVDLSVDDVYTFRSDMGSNTIEVRDGAVSMKSADCPDKVCVRMGAKDKNGETITCLPHKLVIEVHGGQEQEVDIK